MEAGSSLFSKKVPQGLRSRNVACFKNLSKTFIEQQLKSRDSLIHTALVTMLTNVLCRICSLCNMLHYYCIMYTDAILAISGQCFKDSTSEKSLSLYPGGGLRSLSALVLFPIPLFLRLSSFHGYNYKRINTG